MMKSAKRYVLLACLLVVVICGAAHAAEKEAALGGKMHALFEANHFGSDWGLMLGVKIWSNEWSMPFEQSMSVDDKYIMQFESNQKSVFIPAFLLRRRNFFIGGSYMPETDYKFSSQTIFGVLGEDEDENTVLGAIELDPSASRKEWDLNIGYFITPNLALSFGYKKLERNLTNTYQFQNSKTIEDAPLEAYGPIIGGSASLPITTKFNLYGNLAYGWLDGKSSQKKRGGSDNWDFKFDLEGHYYFSELGVNYVIPLQQQIVSAVTINLGYRYQRLDYLFDRKNATGDPRWGQSGDQNDYTSGFVLGVSGAF